MYYLNTCSPEIHPLSEYNGWVDANYDKEVTGFQTGKI